MSSNRTNGFALPAAIGGLVIVGTLVTAGFFMARQELRSGVASKHAGLAISVAQSGANDVLANQTQILSAMAVWDTLTLVDTVDVGIWRVHATRVADRLFFLESEGEVTEGGALWAGATRRVGVVTRIETADINPPAALTTQGNINYGGSSEVHGLDEIPDGSTGGSADWTSLCSAPTGTTDKPGILTNDTTLIDWNGNRAQIEADMTGDPKFDQDPSITTSSLLDFGDMDWAAMTALADIVITGSPTLQPLEVLTATGTCDISVDTNWGAPTDPTSPCFNYFPVIWSSGAGTLHLSGGIGQGILLVDGDLKVNGGHEFYGPVFVRGTLTTNGSGGHFWGGVVAANTNFQASTVLGNAVITYSSCSIERALLNNPSLTKIRPIAMRSWVDLSSVES